MGPCGALPISALTPRICSTIQNLSVIYCVAVGAAASVGGVTIRMVLQGVP
jgi:hypothetical protein